MYTIWKRDTEGTKLSSFSRVCWSINNLEGTAAAKPESTCCSQKGLGTVYKDHWSIWNKMSDKHIHTAYTGTDWRILPALLEQGVDHLATHPRHTFWASLARGYIPKHGGRLRWCLSPNPRRPNIPRLWHIDLIIYNPSYWKDVQIGAQA